MSWLIDTKASIPDFAKDIRLNLDAVINRSGLDEVDAHACAFAAAMAANNKDLTFVISTDGPLAGTAECEAAKTAAALMAMNNVWYPFVEMSEDESMKGLPAGLRMNAYATFGGVSKKKFEMYSLAASIVGKCHYCVKSHYDLLKEEGMTTTELMAVGRIAAVIAAVSRVIEE